ncbi:sialate O-acetylesterase [Kribbella sp. DT2]|uniref:sialate O-acetylesterase n=1 Tax=Kribbella sp. DT2 TaxID=3393427 RepID=UPI003CFA42A0
MPRSAPARALVRRSHTGFLIAVATTVLASGASLTALITPASAVHGAAATSCDSAATGFTPVLQLDLPERGSYLNQTPPYSLDRTGEVGSNFDRVGYCVELNGPDGPQWVWTAMEPFTATASRIGLPTRPGELVRQRVGDLEVRSNVPGVTNGSGQTGYLEMWPNQYQESASTQVANASSITFDTDDNPTSPLGYGSFQVGQIGAARPSSIAAKPVFAINTFTESANGLLSLGIGTNLSGQPDWTFASNANRYSQRRLTAYVRTSLVSVTESPQDRQLVPRDGRNGAVVPVAGAVIDPRVRRVQLRVTGAGRTETFTSSSRSFRFTPRITAGLHEYSFELRATGPGVDRVVTRRDGVVSGDVLVVQGQSNAEAAKFNGAANGEESPYLRSFGTPTSDGTISGADRVWHYATGDVTNQSGSVGQWAIRMGRKIVDRYKVPVAIFNGAHGGQPISFFQRNDSNPDDLATNYGRLRQRLQAAGVLDSVKGVLWYQGESDNDNAAVHVGGFNTLLQDWRSDFGAAKYYVYQVRTSPCGTTTTMNVREAQRQLGDTAGVTLLSTNGLSGHDGCHYAYIGGYREMGDHTFAVVGRDLYGGPSAGVAPPNPSRVTAGGSQLVVQLRSTDPLTVGAGVAANFVLEGGAVTISSVAYQPGGKLVLTLSGPATGVTGLTYQGHIGAGPWITNATGTALLAFKLPVT